MLSYLSQKRCKVTSQKRCSHSTRRLEEKAQRRNGNGAMCGCKLCSECSGLSPQLLCAEQWIPVSMLLSGSSIFFSPVTKTMFLNCYNMQKMFHTLVIMYVKHVFNLAWRCTFIVLASLLLSQHRRDHVTRNQLTQSTENHLLLSLGGDNDLCLEKTLQAWTILNLINLGSLDIYILKPSLWNLYIKVLFIENFK